MIQILKITREETGSQCSALRTGLMWSYLEALVIHLAAEFWMCCSFDKVFLGRLAYSALQ